LGVGDSCLGYSELYARRKWRRDGTGMGENEMGLSEERTVLHADLTQAPGPEKGA